MLPTAATAAAAVEAAALPAATAAVSVLAGAEDCVVDPAVPRITVRGGGWAGCSCRSCLQRHAGQLDQYKSARVQVNLTQAS